MVVLADLDLTDPWYIARLGLGGGNHRLQLSAHFFVHFDRNTFCPVTHPASQGLGVAQALKKV